MGELGLEITKTLVSICLPSTSIHQTISSNFLRFGAPFIEFNAEFNFKIQPFYRYSFLLTPSMQNKMIGNMSHSFVSSTAIVHQAFQSQHTGKFTLLLKNRIRGIF